MAAAERILEEGPTGIKKRTRSTEEKEEDEPEVDEVAKAIAPVAAAVATTTTTDAPGSSSTSINVITDAVAGEDVEVEGDADDAGYTPTGMVGLVSLAVLLLGLSAYCYNRPAEA